MCLKVQDKWLLVVVICTTHKLSDQIVCEIRGSVGEFNTFCWGEGGVQLVVKYTSAVRFGPNSFFSLNLLGG